MVYNPRWSYRVAARVRAKINDSGLSKHKVAEVTSIPKTTFNRCYDGEAPWNTVQLEKVAKALRCKPEDLMPSDCSGGEGS